MLDLKTIQTETGRQSRTTQVRHDDALGDLIDRASTALGVDKSVFLRSAIAKEATRVIEEGSRHVLSAGDAALFAAALDTAPAPTAAAQKAARSYRERVVHAD